MTLRASLGEFFQIKKRRAIRLESKLQHEIKRCIRIKDEPESDWVSNALAIFSKVTVCTFHKAITKCEMSYSLAKLILPC